MKNENNVLKYEEVNKIINKNIENFIERQKGRIEFSSIFKDGVSLIYPNFNKFGFRNIVKSAINSYSELFSKTPENPEEKEEREAKLTYYSLIYDFAVTKAKKQGIIAKLFDASNPDFLNKLEETLN